ncbi:hypothetical protein S40285_09622 [Stachybotrys chlorohalonatus IBT 40285]|uniref:Uncharacterized protein n=1 Tax=Stachybotrys chlorohalonatus (strain IBT 40285) TaxID=1283841 RepID=A0A084QRI9_STAC4|nr:hypothetical protein S40285_09622 [Stachybotrys chlorohalonata IBT 40285]
MPVICRDENKLIDKDWAVLGAFGNILQSFEDAVKALEGDGIQRNASTRLEIRYKNMSNALPTITQSPFIPFIIIFCHIIESSDGSDLKHIRNLVETFESTSHFQVHSACEKQHRLFKALYDVAEKYIEVKSRPDSDGQGAMSWQMAQQQYANAFANTPSQGTGIGTIIHAGIVGGPRTKVAANTAFVHTPSHVDSNGVSTGFVDGLVGTAALQNIAFGDVNMEMDLSGAQLWDWFNKHQSIMSMLEDT